MPPIQSIRSNHRLLVPNTLPRRLTHWSLTGCSFLSKFDIRTQTISIIHTVHMQSPNSLRIVGTNFRPQNLLSIIKNFLLSNINKTTFGLRLKLISSSRWKNCLLPNKEDALEDNSWINFRFSVCIRIFAKHQNLWKHWENLRQT